MKMRVVTLITLLLFTLTLFSCITTSENIQKEYSCDDFSENPTSLTDDFDIRVGDKITVRLCSNATTGFEWDYTATGVSVLRETSHDFEEPGTDVPGAAGMEVWTFEAVAKGEIEVHMAYSQPWADGQKDEWTYTMAVTVQ